MGKSGLDMAGAVDMHEHVKRWLSLVHISESGL